ncbi:endonuclease/exonuclease/phosphatase family protein [Knoellia locipacati]|uniref:endonuclease/exonuclease/phosphatase family protein n=1 Tax=Knoellia locipacati TaxID=882824 RepID=UPI00384BC7A5
MKLSTIRHGAALAAAALATTGALGAAAMTPAHAAPISLKIVQHNTDQDKARWNRVVTLIASGSWDAATVQEVCKGWKDDLVAAHPTWTIAYHEQVAKGDCPGGAKGNVVIRPGGGSRFGEAFDVPGEDKNFGIACVKFGKAGRTVHACSTHFTVYADNPKEVRLRQARRVKEITAPWIGNGHSVVVGGDLNTTPTAAALNPVYKYPTTRSSGRFVEAEQLRTGSTGRVGRDTVTGRKIDYVFFSANRTPLSARGTLTFETPVEGKHKILKATTTIR